MGSFFQQRRLLGSGSVATSLVLALFHCLKLWCSIVKEVKEENLVYQTS